MSTTVTLIDDTYSATEASGRKVVELSVSCTNPYTAGGESITTSTYFPTIFYGGGVEMINPSVGIDLAGVGSTGKFRGDTSSTTSAVLQFFNNGLGGTNKAGLLVDNTTANISTLTCFVRMWGR